MSTRAKLEGLVDPVFLRLHNLFKDKNHSQRTRSTIILVLTSSLLLGIIGPLPVANAATKVVTFNANGGTGTMPNQNGTTTYLSGGAYKMGPANVILTAVWSK